MLSVNHSVEELFSYQGERAPHMKPSTPSANVMYNTHRTSQINPNMSSTNIALLSHQRNLRSPYPRHMLPPTPPASHLGTPEADKAAGFMLLLPPASPAVSLKPSWLARAVPHIDYDVVGLCGVWYLFSIVSTNSTKAILSRFPFPITLTQFQFTLNAVLCLALFAVLVAAPKATRFFPTGSIPDLSKLNHSLVKFLTPTSFIVSTTLPMGVFQFVGHITSHKATSVIPVSMVHTIKALSPFTTVLIYRFVYKMEFKTTTYVTLVPLICGIMLTCYKPKKYVLPPGYTGGLMYAFVSMFIFVSQNIFAKKRLTHESSDKTLPSNTGQPKKLDKLTILLFCLIIGFLFTMPFYILLEWRNDRFSLAQVTPTLLCLVVLNGFSHFMQSLLAFSLLGTVSPINYSIASIMKRIVVIVFAFVWESLFSFTGFQTYGILLTGIGLYCYDKWGVPRKQTV